MTSVDRFILKNLDDLSESGVEVAYNKLQERVNQFKLKIDVTEDVRMDQWIIDRINTNIKKK